MEFEGLVARAQLLLEGAVQWIYHVRQRHQVWMCWSATTGMERCRIFAATSCLLENVAALELVHEVEQTPQEKLAPEPNS